MRKYTDRKRKETIEYKVDNLVLSSTKDLKWQMKKTKVREIDRVVCRTL